MKKPRIIDWQGKVASVSPRWELFALAFACGALAVIAWRQRQRIDELWKELDAQRAWIHAIDDGVRVETDGAKTTVQRRVR